MDKKQSISYGNKHPVAPQHLGEKIRIAIFLEENSLNHHKNIVFKNAKKLKNLFSFFMDTFFSVGLIGA